MLTILSGMQSPIFASTNGLGYVRLFNNISVCNNISILIGCYLVGSLQRAV
jgi:hypothetical protein